MYVIQGCLQALANSDFANYSCWLHDVLVPNYFSTIIIVILIRYALSTHRNDCLVLSTFQSLSTLKFWDIPDVIANNIHNKTRNLIYISHLFFQGVQRLVMHLVRESGGLGLHLEHRAGGEPPHGEGATHQQKPGVFIRHIEEGSPAHRYVCLGSC